MCGILAILGIAKGADSMRVEALKLSKKLRHRGPDGSGIYCKGKNVLVHERLALVGVASGGQPLYNKTKDIVMIANNEVYNYPALRKDLESRGHEFSTESDSEVILHQYIDKGVKGLGELVGMFAFILIDESSDTIVIGRDPMGIIPLYIGYGEDGSAWFSNEMNSLQSCVSFEEFPPGHFQVRRGDKLNGSVSTTSFYNPSWRIHGYMPKEPLSLTKLRDSFESAVLSHLMSDPSVKYGVLLSGGLDSSLVASIAARHAKAQGIELHSFAIGLEGSPDLAAAQHVANYIGTKHHSVVFTVQEGIDAVRDVIFHLETFDLTTVRASTPMYLLTRYIKSLGIKIVLSGEGSDEIFGGYLYFHKAPNAAEFQAESVRKVNDLHLYDCLRANKSTMAFGVEVRVPFLDTTFVDYAMNIDPKFKMVTSDAPMEKYILRKAFQDEKNPYMPESVLWRQKEQFSDGVGYRWIDSLREYAASLVSDADLANVAQKFKVNPPSTKEGYFYRSVFDEYYPHPSAAQCVPIQGFTVACSSAAIKHWDAMYQHVNDPSGRAAAAHQSALDVSVPKSKDFSIEVSKNNSLA